MLLGPMMINYIKDKNGSVNSNSRCILQLPNFLHIISETEWILFNLTSSITFIEEAAVGAIRCYGVDHSTDYRQY